MSGDWECAYISGGTIRPVSTRSSSAINLREVQRPSSKLSDTSDLGKYKRSLRLLGLPAEPPVSSRPPPLRPVVRSAKPKLSTRLERRTLSTDDVRSSVLDESESDRGLVSKAVYEEWYFRKLAEAKSKSEARLNKEKEQRWREENVRLNHLGQQEKLEKERKNREKYLEWLKKKEENKERRGEQKKPGRMKSASKEAIEAAYVRWKEEKDREAAAKKDLDEAEELARKERKRIEAEKAFEAWKTKADEELKKSAGKKAEKERSREEDKERDKEERQKEAEASFRAWREAKDRQLKQRAERNKKREERKRAEEEKKQTERQYEAEAAFRNWLESLLEKEKKAA